jgi:hypothetical protein
VTPAEPDAIRGTPGEKAGLTRVHPPKNHSIPELPALFPKKTDFPQKKRRQKLQNGYLVCMEPGTGYMMAGLGLFSLVRLGKRATRLSLPNKERGPADTAARAISKAEPEELVRSRQSRNESNRL